MAMSRAGGMLMHITSLPGPYGTGTFGPEAEAFAARLGAAGIQYWQILPLTPPRKGNSPYHCFSVFAGNPILISPDLLVETGTVTRAEADAIRTDGDEAHALFEQVAPQRDHLLRLSFSRISPDVRDRIQRFSDRNQDWLPDYACFQALRETFDGMPWWTWPDEALKRHEPAALELFREAHSEDILFHSYVQMLFWEQWDRLRAAARTHGVRMLGDMPIYVAQDSADVWAHTPLFDLDEELCPLHVAGVPPDVFSEDGQLWGNPLYRWMAMKHNGYAWWLRRFERELDRLDAVRVDHFRGFESYWAVPAGARTAREGRWECGPGMDLFQRVSEQFPDARIIAEDLGLITEETRAFLNCTGYPGMRVMQFAFDGDGNNEHLPEHHPENGVAYIGTHDNHTLAGWLQQATPEQRKQAVACCGIGGEPIARQCRSWIETLWSSRAWLSVVTPQDLLALDDTRRMNIPGVAEGNWTFRLTRKETKNLDLDWLHAASRRFGRLPKS